MPYNNAAELALNREDAESFLSALDPAATFFTFQTFDDNAQRKNKNLARILHGTLGSRWELLANLNQRGAGIFITVNETDGEGRENGNVKRVRALFIDLDGTPLPAEDAFHVKPHIVIESSPGKWHCYWLVTNCDCKQFEALQKRLIRHYGGDPKITDLPRVMRLPGFVHQKVDKHGRASEPSVTRVAEAHDHPAYTVEDFVEGLPEGENGAAGSSEGDGAAESNWFEQYGQKTDSPSKQLNTAALHNLDAWVPNLFPAAKKSNQGWRVSSAALGRDLQEDLSLTPQGIVDFGLADLGDPREGKRTPIDVVMIWGKHDFSAAVKWLNQVLGREPTAGEPSAGEAPVTPIDLWGHLNPPELPRGLLPAVIEQFALEQGEVMGVDPGGLAAAALVTCAAAIPDSIELQVKKHDRGWTESARLWAALVGMPSTKKTPSLREAIRPLARIDSAYAREYTTAKQVYDNLPSDQRKQATKPKRKQLKLEDTSIEAAQEVLRDNPKGVLCLADELSGWFGSMDKYNSGRGAAKDRGFWLQAWNGGSYSVNRVTRDCYLIENLSVSVLGGIQPDLIRKMVDEAHDDGLIQRLLPIVVRPGTEGQDTPAHDVVDAYAQLIENLHKLEAKFAAGWDNHSSQATRLEFDDDAQAIRRRFEQKHLKLMELEVINKKLAAHIGKYDAFLARLCVVFHCVEHATPRGQGNLFGATPQYGDGAPQRYLPCTITADTAERAAKFLHQFLLRHAAAFYAGILDLSDDHDRLAAVAGHILAHKLDRVTNRDVQRGDRTMRKLTRKDTETVFEQLEALGWVFRRPAPRPADPPHWQVNPEVHRLFAERAGHEAERRAATRGLLAELLK